MEADIKYLFPVEHSSGRDGGKASAAKTSYRVKKKTLTAYYPIGILFN